MAHSYYSKKLKRFLGFANFCQRFIRGLCSVTFPFIFLLRKGPQQLAWNVVDDVSYKRLKTSFTYPQALWIFQALHCGGSYLRVWSGRSAFPGVQRQTKAILCAFYSKDLSPVEINYDIGNWSLLAVKLLQAEWHHWLKGATHSFIHDLHRP